MTPPDRTAIIKVMDTNKANAAITKHLGDIRATVARQLRVSQHYGQWNVDDLTQETVEYLLRITLPAYDPSKGSTVKAWITCQAANIAKNFLRRACNARPHDSVDATDASASDFDAPPTVVTDDSPTPFAALVRARDEHRLATAIERMSDRERTFIATYLDVGSLSKAAQSVGRSPAWATATLRKLRQRLA